MKRHMYRERDYAFAQLVLTLRTAIGLSQVGLAERLGASRHAVADWEGGSSYPKAERLKQLIALGMRASAFAAGREEQEIRALWKAAHQKVLLDEDWLHDLLAPHSPVSLSPPAGMLAAP
ncbi:MAG TPA: helix-turn-helix transcriptional regulator, partial [Ktedonobacteraceae bacterium]